MNNQEQQLQKAISKLEEINEEFNRPNEDVVAISVCHQTRGIIADMFTSYLATKGRVITSYDDIESLREMSREFDKRFDGIDLTAMYCHPERLHVTESYCLDLDRVRECLAIANDVRILVGKNVEQPG